MTLITKPCFSSLLQFTDVPEQSSLKKVLELRVAVIENVRLSECKSFFANYRHSPPLALQTLEAACLYLADLISCHGCAFQVHPFMYKENSSSTSDSDWVGFLPDLLDEWESNLPPWIS